MNEDRFFMSHGVIHDWQTMRHVAADFEEDWQPRLLELLNELENSRRQMARNGLARECSVTGFSCLTWYPVEPAREAA